MAKRIADEEMRFSIIINGDEAQKELFELERSTRKVTQENKALHAERAKLISQGKKESAEYKNLTAQIKENNAVLKTNKARTKELQEEIGITGLTMRQLSQRASLLRMELANMIPGSAERKKMEAELQEINARLKELSLNSQQAESSLSRLAQGFNKYFILFTSIVAAGTGVALSLQKMIDFNSKLSDSQADVMKTTGLTRDEVDDLTRSFGMMKTRTARIELLALATEAGKLGITGVKNLQDFVDTANQLKVALGDDLSDEAIQEVGKMVQIYEVGIATGKDFAGSMLALGSAINEVSSSGANQAPFLVDYLKRQAGIAAQAKLSASDNLGYAATFDEIGQSAEVSATVMNKVWMDLFDNTATYAKIAGMSLKDFNNLLQTDSNAAMIKFLEGLNGNNEGLSVMVEKLADIEVGGARGAQALAAIAGSTDILRERQNLANESLQEATSLTEEYNLKNNNFAATIDKITKKMVGWFASETIVATLEKWAVGFAKLIGATEDSSGRFEIWRERIVAAFKVLLILIATVLSYNAAVKLAALWTARSSAALKVHYALLVVSEVATKSLAIAKALLTLNIRKAVVAYRALAAAMALNPIGLVAAVVALAATAYYAFAESAEEAASAQKLMNDASAQARKDIQAEVSEINGLLAVAQDDKISKGERLKAIKRLNEISPEYLGNLNLENIATQEATTSVDAYVESLIKAAKAKALKAQLDAKVQELIEKENMSNEELITLLDKLAARVLSLGNAKETENRLSEMAEMRKWKEIAATKEEIKVLEDLYKAQLKSNAGPGGNTRTTGPKEGETQVIDGELYVFTNGKWVKKVFTPKGDPGTTKDEYKVDPKREESELRRIQEENDRLKASLISESFQREIALEEANHQAKLAKLREQLIEEAELSRLDTEIVKATASGDTKKVDALAKTKEIWLRRNAELNRQMEYEEVVHQNKIGAIIQKGLEEDFQASQDNYEREKRAREIAHNLEMAALGNDKEARKALQEKYNREEAEREAKHLQDLIAKMKAVMDGGEFKGFELELLSPEQKQALLDFLDEANLKLSELLNKGSGSSGVQGPRIDGDVDILGFSIDQWDQVFNNLDTTAGKIEAAQMAVGAMMNAWSMYSDFMMQRERRDLQNFERSQDQRQQTLQRQLDRGYINQRQYNAAVENLEKETKRKRAEMEYKQAKREKEMTMANIVLNTAAGVAKAIAQGGFVLGIPWAAVVGALGLVQLGLAASVPLPAKGYEQGLYPVQREQDGKIFNARNGGNLRSGLVKKPTILVAEKDPEMIIDGPAWKRMDPDVKNSLYRELGRMGRVPGYERGYYRNDSQPAPGSSSNGSSSEEYALFIAALNRNSNIMEKIEREGVRAIMLRSMENARAMKEDIDDYVDLRNSSKM